MRKSLTLEEKSLLSIHLGRGIISAKNKIFFLLLCTALLHLSTPSGEYIVPYAVYFMLFLQIGIPSLFIIIKKRVYISDNSILIVTILYFLFLLSFFSAIWNEFQILVLQRSLMIYLPLLLLSYLVWCDSEPLGTFIKVAKGLVFFTTFLAAIGIFIYFFGSWEYIDNIRVNLLNIGPFTLMQSVYGTPPLLRISSLTGNPNKLAMWLLFGIPLTIYLISVRRLGFILGSILSFVQVVALVMTFSRAGIAATFLVVFTYYYLYSKNYVSKIKVVFVGLLCISITVSGIFIFGSDMLNNQRFSLDLNGREEAWIVLMNSFKEYALFGIGFGVSYETILEKEGLEISSHNAHLQILTETGLIGYCLVLFLWLFPIIKGLIDIRFVSIKEQRITIIVIVSLLISLFVHQFFEGNILRYDFYTLFWIYLICVLMHPRLKRFV